MSFQSDNAQTVINQEKTMGITLDIENDLRFKEGLEQEKNGIAANLLNEGIEIAFIAKVTGLTVKQVEMIRKERKPGK